MVSRPFGPRNTTHLLSFPCRVLDRSSRYRAFRPVTPGTAPGPCIQGSDSSGATPYPSRITSWFGGGQHHLYRHRLRFPRRRPVSRFSPPLASSLPPAELKARFHGWTRLAWIDPVTTGRECAGFLPFWVSPPLIYARPHVQKLALPVAFSGFRLTHPAGPMRRLSESLGPRGPDVDVECWSEQQQRTPRHAPVIVFTMTCSAFRIVKDRYERRSGRKGIFFSPRTQKPRRCVPWAPTGVLVRSSGGAWLFR